MKETPKKKIAKKIAKKIVESEFKPEEERKLVPRQDLSPKATGPSRMSEQDIEKYQKMLADIARREKTGFFIVSEVKEISDADGQLFEDVEGSLIMNKTNIVTVLQTLMHSLNLTRAQAMMAIMSASVEDKKSE